MVHNDIHSDGGGQVEDLVSTITGVRYSCGIEYVTPAKCKTRMVYDRFEIPAGTGGKIIKDDAAIPSIEQTLRQVAADKSGAPGHYRFHGIPPPRSIPLE